MPDGNSRVYVFRSPGGGDGAENPFGRLKWILGIIAALYLFHLWQIGPASFIRTLIQYSILIPVILVSLTVHEYAHARMADFLGDPTPRHLGRLSLDPRRHLDFLGALMLFFAGFGWAKPVPVNPEYFRNPSRAMMSVSLAGPGSNLIMALLGGGLMRLFMELQGMLHFHETATLIAVIFCEQFIKINLGLAIFNMLPVPPLDGSKVLNHFLSPAQKFKFRSIEEIGNLLLMLLLMFGVIGWILIPIVEKGNFYILKLFGLAWMFHLQ
ncbi:MAG: site-2 protease family protein [Candidatus Ozemobacteraceae bacterium]